MPEYDFSQGFARLAAALGEGSDEIPFIAQMHEFSMRQSGVPAREFYTRAEPFVRGNLETARAFGFDTPDLTWDVYNVEAEALGAKLELFDEMAPAIDNVQPLVTCEKDLARLKAPDPRRAGRFPFVFEALHLYKALTGETPAPCYCAPFTLAAQIMSFERLVLAIKDDPAFVHKVLAFVTEEVLAPYINAMLADFPEAKKADGSDAIASLPFITQDMLEEFSLQYIERLQKLCGGKPVCDNWWGDSFADDKEAFWDLKLRATPLYLKVQDPDLFKLGAERARDYATRRGVPLVLGVDNNVLQKGPVEAIEKRIHEYMEIGGRDRRFILYLCSLSAETPVAHVRAAVDAIKRFRAGERPYAGLRESGRASAKVEAAPPPAARIDGRATAAEPAREAVEERLDAIFDAVMAYEDETVARLVDAALADGIDLHEILDDALIAAMDDIGEMFSEGTIFVPEMLLAARAMKAGLEVLRPILTQSAVEPKGTVMLATVQGDVHDIGKNLVGMMLEGAGYRVVDLGVNVAADEVIAKVDEVRPDVVGLSALLTTSMPAMARTVAAFKERKIACPVIVGGAPVTDAFAESIGADGYGENAPAAVALVGGFVGGGGSATCAA